MSVYINRCTRRHDERTAALVAEFGGELPMAGDEGVKLTRDTLDGRYNVSLKGVKLGWVRRQRDGAWAAYRATGWIEGERLGDHFKLRRDAVDEVLFETQWRHR